MNIKIKFLTVILCFCTLIIKAGDKSILTVKVAENSSLVLQLSNVKEAQIQVTLKDLYGVTLHDETLMQHNLDLRKYNLQELPSGSFSLIVAYDDVIKIQPIKKENDVILIEEDKVQTIFRPTFRQHDTYVDLNMLCLSDKKLTIMIEDDKGQIIYSEVNQPKGTLEKRFNLSKLAEGSYSFSVRFSGHILNREFKEKFQWSHDKLVM